MIAERTSVYDLTNGTVTGFGADVERCPSAIAAILYRFAGGCVRFLKAPVLPCAEVWEAGVTVALLHEHETRPGQCVVVQDYRTDAWLRH